jgi:hypothetical protein
MLHTTTPKTTLPELQIRACGSGRPVRHRSGMRLEGRHPDQRNRLLCWRPLGAASSSVPGWGLLCAAALMLNLPAAAQMTVTSSKSSPDTIDKAYNGKVLKTDFVAQGGVTTGAAVTFIHQSILGVDSKWVDGTDTIAATHDYRLQVAIDSPGKCWELEITSYRIGQLGCFDDDNKGWAGANLGGLTTSINGVGDAGLTLADGVGITNSGNPDNHVTATINSGAKTIKRTGENSQVVTIDHHWAASVSSTVQLVSGGDEGLVQFGIKPGDGGNSEFQNGNSPSDAWGHFTTLKIKLTAPPVFLDHCPPAPLVFCEGSSGTISAGNIGGDELQYVWKQGNKIRGYTKDLYISSFTLEDAGAYTLEAFNSCKSIKSCPIYVTVKPKPQFKFKLSRLGGTSWVNAVCVGQTWALCGVQTLGEPGVYAWQLNGGPVISTLPCIFFPNIQKSASGTYTLTITNACGSTTKHFKLGVHNCGGTLGGGGGAGLGTLGASYWHAQLMPSAIGVADQGYLEQLYNGQVRIEDFGVASLLGTSPGQHAGALGLPYSTAGVIMVTEYDVEGPATGGLEGDLAQWAGADWPAPLAPGEWLELTGSHPGQS